MNSPDFSKYLPPMRGRGDPRERVEAPRLNEATLVTYLKMVLAREWLVLLVILLFVSLTFLVAKSPTPIYRASTTHPHRVHKAAGHIDRPAVFGWSGKSRVLPDQAEFLKSRDVAARVVRELKQSNPEAFTSSTLPGLSR